MNSLQALKEVKEMLFELKHAWNPQDVESTNAHMRRIEALDFVIKQAEQRCKIANEWIAIEEQGSVEEAENFYTIVQNILAGDSNE